MLQLKTPQPNLELGFIKNFPQKLTVLWLLAIGFLVNCTHVPKKQVQTDIKSLNPERTYQAVTPTVYKNWGDACKAKDLYACNAIKKNSNSYVAPSTSVLQTSTNENTTVINVLSREKNIRILLRKSKTVLRVYTPNSFTEDKLSYLSTILLEDLEKGNYQIDILNSAGSLIDSRNFKASSPDFKNISIASCMNQSYLEDQKQQWAVLFQQNPSLIFLIGDNFYLRPRKKDKLKPVTPQTMWERHTQNRWSVDLFRQKNLIPTYTIWDDNDYGHNDADSSFKYKKEAQDYYRLFFPVHNITKTVVTGPGLSFVLKDSTSSFFFLDNRSFRVNGKIQYGAKQLKWFNKHFGRTPSSVLIDGGQFFGSHHPYESFSNNTNQGFKSFLTLLKNRKKKVYFVSGDRHLTELQDIPKEILGYKTFEITTSGFYSKVFKNAIKNNRSAYLYNGKDYEYNFMQLNHTSTSTRFKIIGNAGRTIYSYSYTL